MAIAEDRRAALIAAAAADALHEDEARELDAARVEDPSIDAEIAALRATAAEARAAVPSWAEAPVDPALRARVLGAIADSAAVPEDAAGPPRPLAAPVPLPRRRARWAVPLLAAACLAIGAGAGAALPALLDAPPSGPPGTLGAVEEVAVQDALPEAEIDARIVAHTWGTEAILEASGLREGASYAIVMVGVDGVAHSAGAMLGSAVEIRCSVNAAVLRPEVARLEIRDAEERVVASAELPRP